MIEKKIYECKYCGQTMLDPELCKEHEAAHRSIDEILTENYISTMAYPKILEVKSSDGKIVRYDFVKVIR